MKIHNPETLIVVCAYSGDRHQVEQNMPVYTHHGCPVVIMSPEDAPVDIAPHICLKAGKAGWIGPHTLERYEKHLRLALKYPFKHYLFHDADSVCLSPQLPKYLYDQSETIWGNFEIDTNPAPSLLPKLALQPPFFLSRGSLVAMLEATKNLPISYFTNAVNPPHWPLPFPTACPDHFLFQLVCGSKRPYDHFLTGASFETETAGGRAEMRNLVRNHGRVLLHSIKRKEVLEELISDHAEWRKTNP